MKGRKKFISDWARIWIWFISLILFVNMLSIAQVYAKKAEDKLMKEFEVYCVEVLEREVNQI